MENTSIRRDELRGWGNLRDWVEALHVNTQMMRNSHLLQVPAVDSREPRHH